MENVAPQTVVTCSQCGGELHPDEGQMFLTCPYCSSTVYLDKSQVVFHWYLAPTLDEQAARGALRRWMAGNQTVKDLDQKAIITGSEFVYFPMWYFKRKRGEIEDILLQLAAATSVSELKHMRVPAGDLRKYDPELDGQAVAPSVPLETALAWLRENQVEAGELVEKALVHLPLYTFKYQYQGQVYTALVEAGTGQVFANIFPAKAEAPYLMVGGITALVFLCLATFPIIGAISADIGGFGIGLLVCGGVGLVAAPALFALAAWVASKV
jgi:DNA-directed RNA polymerase subunit RPC12/RpoP